MNIARFVAFAFLLFFSMISFAATGPTDAERKEEAAREYEHCMFLGKYTGISGVISYVRGQQSGSSLYSNSRKLAQENCIADSLGLVRYKDLDEIIAADDGVNLVPVVVPFVVVEDGSLAPSRTPFVVNSGVPRERHVSRPWARDWLYEIAQYQSEVSGGKKLYVASLVRSRVDQDGLSKVNKFYRRIKGKIKIRMSKKRSFADCSSSAVCSTHLTGAAIDISLRGVTKKERKLLSERLLQDRENGRILVIHERKGNHFHVFVLPRQNIFLMESLQLFGNIMRESVPASAVSEVLTEPQAD